MRQTLLILLTVLSPQAWSHGYTPAQTCSSEKFNYIQRHQVNPEAVHFTPLEHFYIDHYSNIKVCLDDDDHTSDYGTGQCRFKCRAKWGADLEHRPLSPEDFGLPDGVTLTNMYFAPACKGVFAISK